MAPELPTPNGKPPKANAKKAAVDPNVLEVVFGNLVIRPWYPSFYPEQLVGRTVERLYVCQWCFKYSKVLMSFLGHLKCCDLRPGGGEKGEGCGVPGEEVYRKDGFSLYEIDGEEYKVCTYQSTMVPTILWLDFAADGPSSYTPKTSPSSQSSFSILNPFSTT